MIQKRFTDIFPCNINQTGAENGVHSETSNLLDCGCRTTLIITCFCLI